jgi:hypothetical protein
MYLAAIAVVMSVQVNVVRAKRLYPRALMGPFTDDVDLTAADRRAYSDAAKSQRAKDFETIDVTFDDGGTGAGGGGADAGAGVSPGAAAPSEGRGPRSST